MTGSTTTATPNDLKHLMDNHIRTSGLRCSNDFALERLGASFSVEEIPGTYHKATGYRYNLLENGTVIAQAAHPQSMFRKIDEIAKARGISAAKGKK